ncbi:hypothetical protein ACIBTZ_24435 [Micromonospora sp. NPDC049460]|uniref:hypothetical protein n=1 Tax=unclassified Micromonospora TaxID=2617518 RepID=UPI0037234EA8
MVKVAVSTSVQVRGGPAVSVATTVDPASYAFATVDLEPGDSQEVALLPAGGTPLLLAVRAIDGAGKSAVVEVTPKSGEATGDKLTVSGHLLVANATALDALVDGGPRTLALANRGERSVLVEMLACLDQPST